MATQYTPAIATINFVFTSLENIQNIESILGDATSQIPTLELINPLVVAQYALYNTDLEGENFGIDDNIYLGFKGGFITAGDKFDIKRSSFELRGSLTVREKTSFFSTINLNNNSIINVKEKSNTFINNVLKNTTNDNECLTVGDFRRNVHDKGMIMMWSGTYDQLKLSLPYWRLCAPPDSGNTENGVAIPNLEGSFIISGGYSNNTYQPTDNGGISFGSPIGITIGTQGGYNGVYITIDQMSRHKHGVNHNVSGGRVDVVPSNVRLYRGGGTISSVEPKIASAICATNVNCPDICTCSAGPTNADSSCTSNGEFDCYRNPGSSCQDTSGYVHPAGYSVNPATLTTQPILGSIGIDDPELQGSVTSITPIGNSVAHENRPPFYVLGYIINVGKNR
jgi:microcystin-dependent protein